MEELNLYTQEDARLAMSTGVTGTEASLVKWRTTLHIAERLKAKVCAICGLCMEYPQACRKKEDYIDVCPLKVDPVNKDNHTNCIDPYWQAANAIDSLIVASYDMIARLERLQKEEAMPKFEPVTLTAKTKEEADLLWHILNNSIDSSIVEYTERNDVLKDRPQTKIRDTKYYLWDRFDHDHTPKE